MTTKRKKKNGLGPAQSALGGCAKQIDHMIALIGQGNLVLLTRAEKNQLLKLRKGGRDVVRSLAALATKYDVHELPTGSMLEGVAYGEQLTELVAQTKLLQSLLADLLLKVHGGAWKVAMQTYSLLQARAAIDPRIAHDLEPVAKVLSTRDARRRNQAIEAAAEAKAKGTAPKADAQGTAETSDKPAPPLPSAGGA